jgi:hypothetical protein
MMTATETKPLTPLSSGVVLLVGVKPSNLGDDLKDHPRVLCWESQHEHWTNKALPSNVRAIFLTRFISHAAFTRLVTEARKRQIPIFNPMGTGVVVRHVRELLGLIRPLPQTKETVMMHSMSDDAAPETTARPLPAPTAPLLYRKSKLQGLVPFIDYSKTNTENAQALLAKAGEMKLSTSEHSLMQFVAKLRRRQGSVSDRPARPTAEPTTLDVTVQMLDNSIKDLRDMREFLIATVKENRALKARIEKFKRVIEGGD